MICSLVTRFSDIHKFSVDSAHSLPLVLRGEGPYDVYPFVYVSTVQLILPMNFTSVNGGGFFLP